MNEGNHDRGYTCSLVGAVFLLVVVIAVLSYRFFAGPADGPQDRAGHQEPNQSTTRGRQVTPAMVEVYSFFLFSELMCQVIQAMFPHIPPSSIAYDLSRTGSVEITTNNILSRNSLPSVISTEIFS
jgi:peptidoglycan/LPS O-acetylase OafA/YrhL